MRNNKVYNVKSIIANLPSIYNNTICEIMRHIIKEEKVLHTYKNQLSTTSITILLNVLYIDRAKELMCICKQKLHKLPFYNMPTTCTYSST